MIVKNEEVFLDTALKSARSLLKLEDVVITDTGSTDRTKEIALENGAKVFDFTWCDDFSAARNFATEKAKNDWILFLDADEEVTEFDFTILNDFLLNNQVIGMMLLMDLSQKTQSRLARIYNRMFYSFNGSIHEQLRPFNAQTQLLAKNSGIKAVHHGYLPEYAKVTGKLERNERLLILELTKRPGDPYLLYQLGKSYFCNDRNLNKACDYFSRALSAGVNTGIGYIYDLIECYGYSLINTGQFERALDIRNRYAEFYISNINFRFLSAHIYQNNGMLQEAVESYESCIGADTDDMKGINSFLSYYNIGVILECVGMIEDAVRMYQNCGDYELAKQRLVELRYDN